MPVYYYGDRISPNISRILAGDGYFLVCHNVRIARVGSMTYTARELNKPGDPNRLITVFRSAAEVFDINSLGSFNAKPVVSPHPPEDVSPSNYSLYQKGHVQNVRRGTGEDEGYVIADLVITDPSLISDIENGILREISCGYDCNWIDQPDGTVQQQNIRGNHVAVVPEGRAGATVAIRDSAQDIPAADSTPPNTSRTKEITHMSTTKLTPVQRILQFFGAAVRDAKSPEEMERAVDNAAALLDETMVPTVDTADANAAPAPPAAAANPDAEGDAAALTKALQPVMQALTELTKRIDTLEKSGTDAAAATEPDALGELLEQLGATVEGNAAAGETETEDATIDPVENEESVTVPAEEIGDCAAMDKAARDATIALVTKLKPVVARIADKAERQRVVDAISAAVLPQGDGSKRMGAIMDATKSTAKRVADAAPGRIDIAAQQAAYDALNPHKAGK